MFFTRSHGYATRTSKDYVAHDYSIDLTRRSLRHDGIIFWNKISSTIGTCTTVNTFKRNLKRYLLTNPQ